MLLTHLHDRSFTKILFNLGHGSLKSLQLIAILRLGRSFLKVQFVFLCHNILLVISV